MWTLFTNSSVRFVFSKQSILFDYSADSFMIISWYHDYLTSKVSFSKHSKLERSSHWSQSYKVKMIILGLLVFFLAGLANGEFGIFRIRCELQTLLQITFKVKQNYSKKKTNCKVLISLFYTKANIYERFSKTDKYNEHWWQLCFLLSRKSFVTSDSFVPKRVKPYS